MTVHIIKLIRIFQQQFSQCGINKGSSKFGLLSNLDKIPLHVQKYNE